MPESSGADVSLGDILRQLDHSAKERLVSLLQVDRSLKAVRLVCPAIRDVIDCSVRQVNFHLHPECIATLHQGVASPLKRCTRCSTVAVRGLATPEPQLPGSLLSLPFIGLPLQARQRITSLSLSWAHPVSGTALSSLLQRLPSLQHLSLNGIITDDSVETHILCDALASLPHLKYLDLPCCRALDGLGALAGSTSLYRLDVSLNDPLDTAMAEGIGRLKHLRFLSIGLESMDELGTLLAAMPDSVEEVELPECTALDGCDVLLELEAGAITEIYATLADVYLEELVAFAGQALLPSGRAEQRLQSITLDCVAIIPQEAHHLDSADAQPLRELLSRCAHVEVGSLRLGAEVGVRAAEQALTLFGAGTKLLQLGITDSRDDYIGVELQPAMRLATARLGSGLAGGGRPEPGPPGLLDLMLQQLSAEGAVVSHSDTGGIASASPGSGGGGLALLLLRCRLPPHVAPPPDGRQDLDEWVRQVAKQATQAIALARAGAAPSRAEYLPLPCGPTSAAALLTCRSPAELAVAADAAQVVARGVAAFAEDGRASPLEVTPLLLERKGTRLSCATDAVAFALSQVAQSVLDCQGFTAGWSEGQRLRWLLEQWALLGALSFGMDPP